MRALHAALLVLVLLGAEAAVARNDGAGWTDPSAIDDNADTDSGDDAVVTVRTDDLGAWVLAWESDEDVGGTLGTDFDILTSTFTRSRRS